MHAQCITCSTYRVYGQLRARGAGGEAGMEYITLEHAVLQSNFNLIYVVKTTRTRRKQEISLSATGWLASH